MSFRSFFWPFLDLWRQAVSEPPLVLRVKGKGQEGHSRGRESLLGRSRPFRVIALAGRAQVAAISPIESGYAALDSPGGTRPYIYMENLRPSNHGQTSILNTRRIRSLSLRFP